MWGQECGLRCVFSRYVAATLAPSKGLPAASNIAHLDSSPFPRAAGTADLPVALAVAEEMQQRCVE